MKRKIIIAAIISLLLLSSCESRYKDLNADESVTYLSERYGGNYEFISSDMRKEGQYDYLDSDSVRFSDEKSDIHNDEITIFTFKDENDVEFYMTHIFKYGFSGHYVMHDDYCVQWLRNQPELYLPLMDSEFECEYFNEIGYQEHPKAGFILHVDSFDKLQSAVELAYQVVNNQSAILPDTGTVRDDIQAYAVYPSIWICAANNTIIGGPTISFSSRSEKIETSLEEYIVEYSQEYVDLVRDGIINEQLSDEVMKKYGPERIELVKFKGEDLGLFFCRDEESVKNIVNGDGGIIYYTYEQSNDDEPLKFPRIAKYAGCAGYFVKKDNDDTFVLSNGKDVVMLKRNKRSVSITKNGEKIKLKGSFGAISGTSQIVLTTDDLYTIFGIRVKIDMVQESAELVQE